MLNAGSVLENRQNEKRERLELVANYLLYDLIFGSSVKWIDLYNN